MTTLVCVPIWVEDVERSLAQAAIAAEHGADLVEYRIDTMLEEGLDSAQAEAIRLVADSPLPSIVTCRSALEGGHYAGPEDERVSLYEALGNVPRPPRFLDFEAASYERSANIRQKIGLAVEHPHQVRDLSTSLILSAHDFQGRPANLISQIARMCAHEAASVLKIAYRARSLRDNLELFELLRERERPLIALGMGEFGLMSRVLAPKFGGFLTFASLDVASGTAPGQPTIEALLALYRFRSIGPATRVFGVIGWPVGHSISPAVHNAGFEAVGEDAVYLPLPIPPEWEHFKATVLEMLDDHHLDFGGASVTLPHKEHLLRLAREDTSRRWSIDAQADRLGAANTLVVDADGSCRVLNTDADAAVGPLAEMLGGIDGKRVGVVGAGGAGQSIAGALVDAGATVVVYNRTLSRAESVCQKINDRAGSNGLPGGKAVAADLDSLCKSCCDAFVNCTPIGMTGGPDPTGSPIDRGLLGGMSPETVVFDTVYTPIETPLLRAVREQGLRTIRGVTMFTRQAEGQFAAWTGKTAPRRTFEETAFRALEAAKNVPTDKREPPTFGGESEG